MTVTCPSCKRKYHLEESLVKSPQQKMRCSRCSHVFAIGQDRSGKRERPLLSPPGIAEKVGPIKQARQGRGPRRVLVILLVIVALAAGAYFLWTNYLGVGNRWISIGKMVGQETIIRNGRVFLINGVVANRSGKARQYVILKAKLFDQKGDVLAERPALAGFPLSPDAVKQMSKEEIDKKLEEFRLSKSLEAFLLQANKDLPFSIVFSDSYPGKPKEFTVEVAESPPL
jgi:predicted Zn finger-like uncharacterized protein